MLIEHWVTTTRCIKEGRAKMTIGQCHCHRTCQNWHGSNQQVCRDQPSPNEERHLHHGHTRRSHVKYRRDDVNRTHNRRHTQDVNCENHHVHTHTRLNRQWRVHCPTNSSSTSGRKQCTHEQDASRGKQPETPVVHPRESHIRRTNHHWNLPVSKTNERRHDGPEHHDQTV